nr:lysine biosynthesis protein LysW [Candidatus Korarchaeota archaeon]
MAKCEECDAEINIPEDALEGEIVTCPECGASFEL